MGGLTARPKPAPTYKLITDPPRFGVSLAGVGQWRGSLTNEVNLTDITWFLNVTFVADQLPALFSWKERNMKLLDLSIALILGILIGITLTNCANEISHKHKEGVTNIKDEPQGGEGTESHFIEMDISAFCRESCCCGEFADGYTASGAVAGGLICAARLF